jgi:hypothetical protein
MNPILGTRSPSPVTTSQLLLVGQNCTLDKLTVATNIPPGSTNSVATYTVQVPGPSFSLNPVSGMMDSTLSCQIGDPLNPGNTQTQCTSNASVQVTAGQFITMKVMLTNATTPAGFFSYWSMSCQ